MREVVAGAAISVLVVGCATPGVAPTGPRYAEILSGPATPADVKEKVAPPSGACADRAREYVGSDAQLMATPLPPDFSRRMGVVLDGLHPVAKQVLRRTAGVWFARDIPGAAAVFLPCEIDVAAGTGGFILVDASEFPLDRPLHDGEVPGLYWRALASPAAPHRPTRAAREGSARRGAAASAPAMRDHAVRYLLLHELGHAASLLAGEFGLDDENRLQVEGTSGFVGLSWRIMTTDRKYLPLAGRSPVVQAVVPREGLDPFGWGTVLAALDADPERLAPGYALAMPRSEASKERDVCGVVAELPRAGFVTPTAARYPTEDFAEMFAHAILAREGKLRPDDVVPIALPGCAVTSVGAPYFADGVLAKRVYLERALFGNVR